MEKATKSQEKTQNSRAKLITQGKTSMSGRIAPLLTFQVMLRKAWTREARGNFSGAHASNSIKLHFTFYNLGQNVIPYEFLDQLVSGEWHEGWYFHTNNRKIQCKITSIHLHGGTLAWP